jgi:hypothetical protein
MKVICCKEQKKEKCYFLQAGHKLPSTFLSTDKRINFQQKKLLIIPVSIEIVFVWQELGAKEIY